MHWTKKLIASVAVYGLGLVAAWPAVIMQLTGVPDYSWYAGWFGTASGNLMGYWDRHGLPDYYTGPTAGGVAPLDSFGGNVGIRSLWASRAGLDGRPIFQAGHVDDYWTYYTNDFTFSYESTDPDPYALAHRPEHAPDCIGDFIGLSQNKWTNLNAECDGNIDASAFVFWDRTGARRENFVPPPQGAAPVPDIPSGLRDWTRYRGDDAVVFSQLTDFNPSKPPSAGFTFDDLKAEINAGYPVLLFLQSYTENSRELTNQTPMPRANPLTQGLLAYGYAIDVNGTNWVYYRNSLGTSTPDTRKPWTSVPFEVGLPVRGVIGYHPLPKITRLSYSNQTLTVEWDGPSSILSNGVSGASTKVHRYVVQKSSTLAAGSFTDASAPTAEGQATIANCCVGPTFFRVRMLPPASPP